MRRHGGWVVGDGRGDVEVGLGETCCVVANKSGWGNSLLLVRVGLRGVVGLGRGYLGLVLVLLLEHGLSHPVGEDDMVP